MVRHLLKPSVPLMLFDDRRVLVARDAHTSFPEVTMRIGSVLLVIWLGIGAFAAGQRDYFDSSKTNCAKVSTIAVTVLAGPLNYVGVNPRISCKTPQPSK
jgi:hypothetical protein